MTLSTGKGVLTVEFSVISGTLIVYYRGGSCETKAGRKVLDRSILQMVYTCNMSKFVCNYFLNKKRKLGESQFLKL